jgi:hypothetical protein
MTRDRKHVIVDFDFNDEDLSGYIEGEGWMDGLVELREALIQGDFRILYLAWLKAAEAALAAEDIGEDMLEPPVPAGLGELSPALDTFVEFLNIDEGMIVAAAQESSNLGEKHNQHEKWIERLSETEKNDFLVRLCRGEKNLSVFLNRRLLELAGEGQPQNEAAPARARRVSVLMEAARIWWRNKEKEEERKAELERKRKMEALAARERQVWSEVEALIEEKKSRPYDQAVRLLLDLRDLAESRGELEKFRLRMVEYSRTYATRSALLDRMRRADLFAGARF